MTKANILKYISEAKKVTLGRKGCVDYTVTREGDEKPMLAVRIDTDLALTALAVAAASAVCLAALILRRIFR